jgi:cobalamin-dependent methionine synthase I
MIQTLKTAQMINIDSKQILNQIGYEDEYEPSARIKSLVNDYIENYHNLIELAYSYTFRDIESAQRDCVDIADSIILESKVISSLARRCDKVAVFVLTIGNRLEEMVAYLAENRLVLQATVLDAIGSEAAEQLAEILEERIRNIVGYQNQVISRRFSPGYCDWNVNQQEMIFRALGDDTAGVRLTAEYLMLPRKSVSGIIGIGEHDSGIDDYNPCRTCTKQDCPGRRL